MEILSLIGALGALFTAVGAGYAYAVVRLNKQIAEGEYEISKLEAALDQQAEDYERLATTYLNNVQTAADTEGELAAARQRAEDHRYAYTKQQAELMFWRGKVQLTLGDDEVQRLKDEWSMLYRYESNNNTVSSKADLD